MTKEFDVILRLPGQALDTDITLTQNDYNVYRFNIRVFDGMDEIDYSQITEATITFAKRDKTVVQGDIQIMSDKLVYTLGTNEIACPGRVLASVQLMDNNSRLTTARFVFAVESDLITEDSIKSSTEYPILKKLADFTNDVDKALDTYEKMIKTSFVVPKPPVDTYDDIATIYPEPENGWTTRAIDTGRMYRYNVELEEWEWIDTVTTTAYDALLQMYEEVLSKLNEPEYTPQLSNTASVFSVGTGYDESGNYIDLSESVVEGQVGDLIVNGVTDPDSGKSVIGAIRVKSVGKNLWDEKNNTVFVQPNTNYTFSCDNSNIGAFIEEYNKDGINIYCETVDSGSYITTKNDTRKIKYRAIQSKYTDTNIYGVEVDFVNNNFTRLAGAVGKNPGADFDSINAFGGRRRCNLADDGTVNAYYGDPEYVEDGSNGQVMVEQPKFYYKVVPLKLEKIQDGIGYHLRKARYYVSDTPKVGFKVHPAFVRNGVEVDKIYLSAYEGSIYDESAGTYLLNDEQVADFDNDKLSSIAGAKPCSGLTQNLTRANTRKLANNRGVGWQQKDVLCVSASQMLMMIEYAAFNMQSAIGLGVVNKPSGESNESELTGATSNLGNASGMAVGTNGLVSISYRGEENFWGNIWKWIDGLNVYIDPGTRKTDAYWAAENFADNTGSAPYKHVGFNLAPNTSGYISAFGWSEECDFLFLPTETLGNSALPVGDRFYNVLTGWRVARLGGSWSFGLNAGAFDWDVYYPSDYHSWAISGGAVYVPQTTT